MKKKKDDEPKVWVTALKLILIAAALIGGVGLALWYAKDMESGTPDPAKDQWGISHDSPLRMKR